MRYRIALKIDISIHAPREGGDGSVAVADGGVSLFQSTPPARGATRLYRYLWPASVISIHAPREGGDLLQMIMFCGRLRFQSTPPARGATFPQSLPDLSSDISIHAPREGGDY